MSVAIRLAATIKKLNDMHNITAGHFPQERALTSLSQTIVFRSQEQGIDERHHCEDQSLGVHAFARIQAIGEQTECTAFLFPIHG